MMTGWLDNLRPDAYVASIYDIDLDKLWNEGKRLILTDLDNTLVPWNHPGVSGQLARWFSRAGDMGFGVCIVSNNHGPRVKAFAEQANVDYIAAARKPKMDGFMEVLRRYNRRADETVMIGDQLFTDIQGGNRCGLTTILVLPIHPKEWWGTRMVRVPERVAMRMLIRRGLQVPEPGQGKEEHTRES